jgi:four helix bundle protein
VPGVLGEGNAVAIYRFEDLIAWQRARVLAGRVYACTREEPFRQDRGLSGQIQRASVSVMANIAEGFEKNRMGEFGRYLDIARGSLAEVRSHLYIASDVGYLPGKSLDEMLTLVDETGKVLAGLRKSIAPGTGHPALGTS